MEREAEWRWREHTGLEPDADDDYWKGEEAVEQMAFFPLSEGDSDAARD